MSRIASLTPNPRWQLRVLGPLELERAGAAVALRRQTRVLFAWLAAHRDGIAISRLVELTWGEAAPSGAARQVFDQLRVGFDGPVVVTGARARLDRHEVAVDEDRFHELVGDAPSRRDLEEALSLWRGPAYGELDHHPDVLPTLHRLEDRRDRALASLYAIRLLEPDVSRVVADLTADWMRHPSSARLSRLVAAGLALAGRRVEALRAARSAAAQEPLGSRWLDDLEAAIQADDDVGLRALVAGFGA